MDIFLHERLESDRMIHAPRAFPLRFASLAGVTKRWPPGAIML